jgi:hypothetical protein
VIRETKFTSVTIDNQESTVKVKEKEKEKENLNNKKEKVIDNQVLPVCCFLHLLFSIIALERDPNVTPHQPPLLQLQASYPLIMTHLTQRESEKVK